MADFLKGQVTQENISDYKCKHYDQKLGLLIENNMSGDDPITSGWKVNTDRLLIGEDEDLMRLSRFNMGFPSCHTSYGKINSTIINSMLPNVFNSPLAISNILSRTSEDFIYLQELQDLIENLFLNKVELAIDRISQVMGQEYNFIISGEMQGDIYQSDIEMDDTEFYIIEAYLHYLNALFHMISTYDVNGIASPMEDFTWMNQDHPSFTIREGKESFMPIAHDELQNLHSCLLSSFEFLQNETDWQGNDYYSNLILDDHEDEIFNNLADLYETINEESMSSITLDGCDSWEDGCSWFFGCECTDITEHSRELPMNINVFMNNPPENFKEYMPGYYTVNGVCTSNDDGEPYPCPLLIWHAATYEEWMEDWQDVDVTVNGLFPEMTVENVISIFDSLFGFNEQTWRQILGEI